MLHAEESAWKNFRKPALLVPGSTGTRPARAALQDCRHACAPPAGMHVPPGQARWRRCAVGQRWVKSAQAHFTLIGLRSQQRSRTKVRCTHRTARTALHAAPTPAAVVTWGRGARHISCFTAARAAARFRARRASQRENSPFSCGEKGCLFLSQDFPFSITFVNF